MAETIKGISNIISMKVMIVKLSHRSTQYFKNS